MKLKISTLTLRSKEQWCDMWVEFLVRSCLVLRIFLQLIWFSSLHKNRRSKILSQSLADLAGAWGEGGWGRAPGTRYFGKKKKENRKRKKGRQTRKNKPNPPLAQGLLPPLGQHRGPEWKPIKADEASSPNIVFYCVFSYLLMYFLRKWMQFISPVSPIRNIVTSTGQLTALLNTSIMLWILFRNAIFQILLSGISRSKI